MFASVRTATNGLIYEVRPRYAFGRFYVEEHDRNSLTFLCPGDLIREALRRGTATLRAQGVGLGWHYPYHLRRVDDGNVKGNITRLNIVATRHTETLDIVADLEVSGEAPQSFKVIITLDVHDLSQIGPDYSELSFS